MSRRIAIYPGTFDPITKGHMDVIKRALLICDHLIIAVADDIPKTPLFPLEERCRLVEGDVASFDTSKITVQNFSGLLMDFAKEHNAQIIIRGLRAVSDFEYEFQLSAMNARLQPDIQTVFLPASEKTQFLASRLVKEIARLGGDVSAFVSKPVADALAGHYKKQDL